MHLLGKNKLTQVNPQARFLAAQSLIESKLWEECIGLLGDEPEAPAKTTEEKKANSRYLFHSDASQMQAALCVLRGKCFHGQENRSRACFWFKRALELDALSCVAFEMLVDNFMLTTDEEAELLSQLDFGSDKWLFDVYASRLKKVRTLRHFRDAFAAGLY